METLTKEKIKSHHFLSAFINSEEITLLIADIKSTIVSIFDKYFQ